MVECTLQLQKLLAIAALCLAASLPLCANTTTAARASREVRCYCECEPAGANHCPVKFCEIPKYRNRWWAASCQKHTTSSAPVPAAPQQRGASRTHAIQTA